MKKLKPTRKFYGRYEGAVFSPDRSIVPGGYTGVKFDATPASRMELARKMRYFERNNSLVQALAGKFENFVVGSNPQVTPLSSDPEWNAKALDWWNEWTEVCDLVSRQPFGTFLSLAARRWFIEGDCFILKTRAPDSIGTIRPRVQLLEGHLCRTPDDLVKDPQVFDGVRLDDFLRPIAYYFGREVGPNRYEFNGPTPSGSVVPVMEPERPGEVRGVTFFHSCINELHGLDDLHLLEMQAAMKNASVSDWIEALDGDISAEELRASRFLAAGVTNTGAVTNEQRVAYYREVAGATTRVMMRGDKIHQHAGERPSVTTREYWRLKMELVCAGVEIPIIMVFPEIMQGTVYRGALDMATAAFCSRHAVIADVVRSIWNYVINFGIKNDIRLADPPADWRKIGILPPRAPNVDVGRNSAAMLAELEVGATNYDLIYSPLGLSAATELKKLNDQLEFIENNLPALDRFLKANRPQAVATGEGAARTAAVRARAAAAASMRAAEEEEVPTR